MGFLAFRQGKTDEAQKWYEQAVKLDSQSYVAHYYFAAMSMNSGAMSADAENQVEASLKAAIKLNPNFAPPYDRLAVFYGMRRKNLGDAHMLGLQAIQLDSTNIGYRINTAKVLADMDRYGDALTVFQNALKITTDPDQITNIQFEMNNIEETIAARKRVEEQKEKLKEEMKAELAIPPTTAATDPQAGSGDVPGIRPEETLRGPHVSELGTIKNVQCSYPARMDFELETGGHLIALHSPNYYKIPFSVLNFTPRSALKPCSDLEGTRARVEYVAPSGKTKAGGIVTIEMIN
jgi:Tfp pilus assembly protein PilF